MSSTTPMKPPQEAAGQPDSQMIRRPNTGSHGFGRRFAQSPPLPAQDADAQEVGTGKDLGKGCVTHDRTLHHRGMTGKNMAAGWEACRS